MLLKDFYKTPTLIVSYVRNQENSASTEYNGVMSKPRYLTGNKTAINAFIDQFDVYPRNSLEILTNEE